MCGGLDHKITYTGNVRAEADVHVSPGHTLAMIITVQERWYKGFLHMIPPYDLPLYL